MPFRSAGPTRYFYFENLEDAGVAHGIFTRRGGSSPAPWESLNVGLLVGDDQDRVAANTRLAVSALARKFESLHTVRQVHGSDVVNVEAVTAPDPIPEADGMVTGRRDVTLAMRFADCVPVLLADPLRQVAGIAHAGWRGTVAKISAQAVQKMVDLFGSNPANMLAGIGPAICSHHYEVGPEVALQVKEAFGTDSGRVLEKHSGRTFFDLWEANRLTLSQAGVGAIEMAGICTADRLDDWYSHRAEKGCTGRFLALIGISGA